MPRALLTALLVAALAPASAPASAADAAVTLELPAGETRHIRLRKLPEGSTVAVRLVASGQVLVALVGAQQLKDRQKPPKAVFRGALKRNLTFRVVIPQSDDYLLVFNNRRGSEAVSIEAQIRAQRGGAKPRPRDYSPRPEKASWSPSWSSISSSSRLT